MKFNKFDNVEILGSPSHISLRFELRGEYLLRTHRVAAGRVDGTVVGGDEFFHVMHSTRTRYDWKLNFPKCLFTGYCFRR